MNVYQVVSPIVVGINGDSFKKAIKNFAKMYHRMNLASIIITDQQRHIEAKFKYFQQDGRNRVGINMYPISAPYIPIITKSSDILKKGNILSPLSETHSPFSLYPYISPMSAISPVSHILPLSIVNNL